MLSNYITVLVCVLFTLLFVTINLYLSRRLAPKIKNVLKSIPYECGEEPEGTPFIQLNPRYYVFALAFLIFDVEIIFMYPVASVFRQWVDRDLGVFVLTETLTFLVILFFGLIYLWKNGDLQWIQTIEKDEL
ncbi:MAG: NADH-quinone oxidoreductase subunit A [Bdellovibrionota bacterium]|nr:NADH-quinone oxidoreductase subunit A [Deltaproteobacteria bacterium]